MKNKIIKILTKAIQNIGGNTTVELTPSKGHGDFSTNAAMKLAKELGDSPINIANKIINEIDVDFIEKLEVAGPGFINIFLTEDLFISSINNIINKEKEFGKGNQGKYINVEYVSANPTGHLHIGHARGAVLGSVLTNILKHSGNRVDAEYYINDAGNQIAVLGESVKVRYLQSLGLKFNLPETSYAGQDVVAVGEYFKEKYGDSLKNEPIERFSIEAKDFLLKVIEEHLNKLGVHFDIWSSEKKLYDDNLIVPALKKLEKHTFKEDEALWLDTVSKGDDKNRVLIKSNGKYTYITPDIAYHNVKLGRGYDELINIWGADHMGYIKRMEIALGYLGLPKEKLDILIIQLVKLFKDGKELKMSKRMGTTFTINELIEEVGKDATRWFMVDRSNNSDFVFDINSATEKSSDNPVFKVQYTHARANQLIEKSTAIQKAGVYTTQEKEIINTLNKFPELIEKISNSHKVHLLPQYLLNLSGEFNSWYTNTKVIGNPNEASLIAFTTAFKNVIGLGLNLLGINFPNKM